MHVPPVQARRSVSRLDLETEAGVDINFDDLPAGPITGEVVSTQYPQATFSSTPGNVNYVTTQPQLTDSPPNFICTGPIGGEIGCMQDTIVSFTSPVSDLTFSAIGVNDSGQVALVDVYTDGTLAATVPIIGQGNGEVPLPVDLSAYTDVTSIDIREITDAGGIGWDDFSFEPGSYVALGDSYSSGEGVPPFLPGSDTGTDECHRSAGAYPELLVKHHQGTSLPTKVSFWACSGSLISDFSNNNHMWGEPPQLTRLEESEPTLVTLSIGGNDIGFAHIGATCLKVNATVFKPLNGQFVENCRKTLNKPTMEKIQNLQLAPLYAKIHEKAPHAEVYVMGYPRVLPAAPTSDCQAQAYREDGRKATGDPFDQNATDGFIGIETRIGKDDAAWMDTVIERLDQKIQSEAAKAGFHYVDVLNAFEGHDICSNNTDPSDRPWAHGLVLNSNSNATPPNPSAFSFHPNAEGQEAMAEALYNTITGSQQTLMPGQTDLLSTLVSIGQAILHVLVGWPGSTVVTTLVSPGGKEYTAGSTGIEHSTNPTSENFVIPDPEPGNWTVKLFGADVHEGGEAVRVESDTVPASSEAPVAAIETSAESGIAPQEVTFNGSGSAGIGAEVSSYEWNFGDGSPNASGATAEHAYTTAGAFDAALTVTDADGRSDTVHKQIVISSVAVAPIARLAVYAEEGQASQVYYEGEASESTDGEIVEYAWDFGDGEHASAPGGFHEYRHDGTFDVTLTVKDNHGLSASATQQVQVTNALEGPSLSASPFGESASGPLGGVQASKVAHAPTLVPRLSFVGATHATKTGMSVKLACAQASCNGRLTLTVVELERAGKLVGVDKARGARRRTVQVGGASFAIAAGAVSTVNVSLTALGRRLRARFKQVPAILAALLDAHPGLSPPAIAVRIAAPRRNAKG